MTTEAVWIERTRKFILDRTGETTDIGDIRKYLLGNYTLDQDDKKIIPSLNCPAYEQIIRNMVSHHSLESSSITRLKTKEGGAVFIGADDPDIEQVIEDEDLIDTRTKTTIDKLFG
jgi:hypothetical protein